jgi:hypothetical protein
VVHHARAVRGASADVNVASVACRPDRLANHL